MGIGMIKPRINNLLKNLKIKTILSLLILPSNEFDKAQLTLVFNEKQMVTRELS